MPRAAALPFTFRTSDDAFGQNGIITTTETIHGVLRLEGDRMVVQWRRAVRQDHVGMEIRSEQDLEPVREVSVPLSEIAAATVRRRWWARPRIVLTATDLRAFEAVAGHEGLRLSHPAELTLMLRRQDRLPAEEFAAEVTLAIAELVSGTSRDRLSAGHSPDALPGDS